MQIGMGNHSPVRGVLHAQTREQPDAREGLGAAALHKTLYDIMVYSKSRAQPNGEIKSPTSRIGMAEQSCRGEVKHDK